MSKAHPVGSFVRWFDDLTLDDLPLVGGKNASLGEMTGSLRQRGVPVPRGFAVTADAYRAFVDHNSLGPGVRSVLEQLSRGDLSLDDAGSQIRERFLEGEVPEVVELEIVEAYAALSERTGREHLDVAVRSSATAEDLPEASFAGQQESFLNVRGSEALVDACRRCFASLFTDRAITYREELGFDHLEVALSVGVQEMVRSDLAGAGVMFTLDPENGFRSVIVIDAAFGLGESVVKGTVNPDRYVLFKPHLNREGIRPVLEISLGTKAQKLTYRPGGRSGTRSVPTSEAEQQRAVLSEAEMVLLARWGCTIEEHYDRPMDIEWAKDGETGELFIVQARPETVESRSAGNVLITYTLIDSPEPLVSGQSVGRAIAVGKAITIASPSESHLFEDGGILVAPQTDPDWGPILARAGGVVTDEGGRTSHAAIVSRELGIPAVVGTRNGTRLIPDGSILTLSCAGGEAGHVYLGALEFERHEVRVDDVPETRTRMMVNIGNPEAAFRWWRLPARGIGLARIEFIISEGIGVHPMALVHPDRVEDATTRSRIRELARGFDDLRDFFVDRLARDVAKLAAVCYPEPAIVRTSDFKTNEYAQLLGGAYFEPDENNPMLGFRGASRYYSERYREGFLLECRALLMAREELGMDNIIPMIPFCRTLEEADRVLEVMEAGGLKRGENGLEVYVMCEIPSNVLLAEEFADRFDGFSIGSNDLTQLVLGVDRDSVDLAHVFDEGNEAVKRMIRDVIVKGHEKGRPVGICGQAPSDHPGFAEFLVEADIDSISLTPDSVIDVTRRVAAIEATLSTSD